MYYPFEIFSWQDLLLGSFVSGYLFFTSLLLIFLSLSTKNFIPATSEVIELKEFLGSNPESGAKFPAFKTRYKYSLNNKVYYSNKVQFTSYIPALTYNTNKWVLNSLRSKYKNKAPLDIWVHKNMPGIAVIDKTPKIHVAIISFIFSLLWPATWLIHSGA